MRQLQEQTSGVRQWQLEISTAILATAVNSPGSLGKMMINRNRCRRLWCVTLAGLVLCRIEQVASVAGNLPVSFYPLSSWDNDLLNGIPYDMVCFPGADAEVEALGIVQPRACTNSWLNLEARLPPNQPCAVGCGTRDWKEILRGFVFGRACRACYTENEVLELQMSNGGDEMQGCIVGQIANALSTMLFYLLKSGTRPEYYPPRRSVERMVKPVAEKAMNLSMVCGDRALLPLLGISAGQVRYLVHQLLYNFSSSAKRHQEEDDQLPRSKYAIDLGMSEGADTRYLLHKGFHVMAVEANATRVVDVRQRLAHHEMRGKLHVVQGFVGKRRPQLPCGALLDFAYGNSTSAASILGVPEPIHFSRTSDRIGLHYLKADLDGVDLDCVNSLKKNARLPTYLSVEFFTSVEPGQPMWDMDSPEADRKRYNAVLLVQHLKKLGYKRFKVVRQQLYNFFHQIPGAEKAWQSSGPFGEEALDFRYGLQWRSSDLAINDMNVIVFDVANNKEWYDLHASLEGGFMIE